MYIGVGNYIVSAAEFSQLVQRVPFGSVYLAYFAYKISDLHKRRAQTL